MTYLIAAFAALVAAVPLAQVSTAQLAKARSYWLLGVLTLGVCYLAWSELWLALIGFAFLCRWRGPEVLGSIVAWGAVGASWALLLMVPAWLYDFIALGWIGVALWNVWLLVQRWRQHKVRVPGMQGSPVLTGLFLALVFPLAPMWLWPVLAAGLVITSSVHAGVAIAAGLMWMWPWTWPYFAGSAVAILGLWVWSPEVRGRRVFEWVLRGDTWDSLWARWYAWRILVHDLGERRAWVLGVGPDSVMKVLRSWSARSGVELPHEASLEALHVTYEYGLVGLAAVLAFGWRVGSHLTVGDPWSAAWVVAVVLGLFHWPWRHAVTGPMILTISARLVLD